MTSSPRHVALMITPATAMPASSETDRRRSREASTARWATGGLLQPRILGQVYDGGLIGSRPGIYYLTHPVQVTGSVGEGSTATLTADSSTTVPVFVLRGTPSIGDYLIAYSAGGRWVSEGAPPAAVAHCRAARARFRCRTWSSHG